MSLFLPFLEKITKFINKEDLFDKREKSLLKQAEPPLGGIKMHLQ